MKQKTKIQETNNKAKSSLLKSQLILEDFIARRKEQIQFINIGNKNENITTVPRYHI